MAGQTPTFIGGFQIQKKLGEGAFGRVFQAYDARVNRLVAIKVLLLRDKEILTRFKNEAIVAGNLRHNNIVTIYEFGEHEGLPFLVMEFLDGENLQEVMRAKKPLTMLQKVSIMTQIAEGLACAHRHGVVHRDVKPANMMLLPDGTVKITDFGIARLTGGQQSTRLTQQGNVLGTLLYMAPEQFTGSADVDALCDIFACGEVFYELLAGRHPFEANEPGILLYKVTAEEPPPLHAVAPDCPLALTAVLARMLSKPRDLRYQSLREVLFDIQPVLIDLQQERAAALIAQAQDLFSREQTDAANALMPEILDLDPANRSAYRLREQIQRALLKPKVDLLLQSGRDELAKRRYSEAILAFDAAARLDNSNAEISDLLARARNAQDQSQKASQLATEARQAFDRQNFPAAFKCASDALLLDPGNSQASHLLLLIQSAMDRKREQQQLDEALVKAEHLLMIQAYDGALDALAGLDPAEERVRQLSKRVRSQKLDHERSSRLQTGMTAAAGMLREQKLAEAVHHLNELAGEFPDKPDVRQLLEYARKELAAQERTEAVRQVIAEAERLAGAHDYRGALAILDKALHQYDDGSLVRTLGQIMAAKAVWERQEAIGAARGKCERLRAEGKLADAVQTAENALRVHGADAGLASLLREVQSEWEQQRRDSEIANAMAQARRFLETGQAEKAVRLLSEAAGKYSEYAEIQTLLAEARESAQVQARRREIETADRDARAHADRADYQAALQLLDRALENYPGEAALSALREEILAKQSELAQRQAVQRTVQEANRMANERRFAEALELVAGALGRYGKDDALLQAQSKLQIDWDRRKREQAIEDACNQGRALLDQGRAGEAANLLRDAGESYPGARELESLLARAQRAAAVGACVQAARTLIDQGDFETALERIQQAMRDWTGERTLAALQSEAASGLAAIRRAQAIREAVERARSLLGQQRPADALRLADSALREYADDTALLAVRLEAQARLDEAARTRRRTTDLESLARLQAETRAITDASQIRELTAKVQALAKTYAGDAEFESAAARLLNLLAGMEQTSTLLSKRDFPGVQAACARLLAEHTNHPFFERMDAEAARGLRRSRPPDSSVETSQPAPEGLADVLNGARRRMGEFDYPAAADALQHAARAYSGHPEFRTLHEQIDFVQRAVQQSRDATARHSYAKATGILETALGRYPDDALLQHERQAVADEAAAREAAIAEAVQKADELVRGHRQDEARRVAESAVNNFGEDPRLAGLLRRVQVIRDARALAADERLPQATHMIQTELGRFPGDALLTSELEALREKAGQQEAHRAQNIRDAVQEIEGLLASNRPEDARTLAEASLQRFPADHDLTEVNAKVQTRISLRRLEDDMRALTATAQIPGLLQAIRAIAGRSPNDPGVAQAAAVMQRQLEDIQQADVLLSKRDFVAVREICRRYPNHRLLETLKADAERGERSARVTDARRQADEEQDLRRKAELLEASLRIFPEEASLQERLRALRERLERAESAAQASRQAEKDQRWDEAAAQWQTVRELDRHYPNLDAEIARVEERKRQAQPQVPRAEPARHNPPPGRPQPEIRSAPAAQMPSAPPPPAAPPAATPRELASPSRPASHQPPSKPWVKNKAIWLPVIAVLGLAGWAAKTMLHAGGTLVVETSPTAMVSVDGAAATPAGDNGIVSIRLSAGKHLVAVSRPGFGRAEQPVEVTSGATSRIAIPLNGPAGNAVSATPVIASLKPGSVVKLGSAFTLALNGTGFQRGTEVRWNGSALRTTYLKATQLRAAVPANLVATPGKASITAVNPGDVASAPVTLPINPAAPAIAGLQPDAVNAGDAAFILKVAGTGFQPGASVHWNSERLETTVESGTSLRAAVNAKLLELPDHAAVTVVNPGDVASSAVTFTINPLRPTPVVSGLDPATVTAGGAAFTLTISGSNFVQGSSAHWNGTALATAVTNSAQLKVAVAANLIATAGTARIAVMNPGNIASAEVNLPVTAPAPAPPPPATGTTPPVPPPAIPPVITGLNPSSAIAGGTGLHITVNGSGFTQNSSVHWNRTPVPTIFVSATQLRAQVTANLIGNAGAPALTVMNPGNVSSGAVNFTIVAPAPAAPPAPAPIVSRLNPGGVRAGGGAFTLTVAGSGFQPASVVNWNRTPLATQFVNPSTLAAAVPESLIAAAGTASITVVNPGNVTSGSLSLTVFSRQISLNDRDAELLKSVLAEYAAAYSQKDFRRVTALFPQMSKEDRKSLQQAFSRNDYRVQFTIEPTSQPVFKGDDATINARTVIVTQAGRQVNPAVSRNVVISLHKNNGQWTISAFR